MVHGHAYDIISMRMHPHFHGEDFNMEEKGFFMDDAMIRRNGLVVDAQMDWPKLWRTDYWGLEMFDPNTWTHKPLAHQGPYLTVIYIISYK